MKLKFCPHCFTIIPRAIEAGHLCNDMGITHVIEDNPIQGVKWQMLFSFRQSRANFNEDHDIECGCRGGVHIVNYTR